MYDKGSVLLNMIRTIINDDEKWREILRGLNKTFYHQTVTYNDITNYISKESGVNLTTVFDQYLHHTTLPTLEIFTSKGKLYCRWIGCVPGFSMPVKIKMRGGEYKYFTPGTVSGRKSVKSVPHPTLIDIDGINRENVEVDTFNYYIGVLKD
jgi:hypothetical protein